MDRRSFFRLGVLGVVPIVGCTGRDNPPPAPGELAVGLDKFRQFTVPEGVEPALDFRPLRQRR